MCQMNLASRLSVESLPCLFVVSCYIPPLQRSIISQVVYEVAPNVRLQAIIELVVVLFISTVSKQFEIDRKMRDEWIKRQE